VVVKVLYGNQNRRFKLPLRDLGAQVLPQKLRVLLTVADGTELLLERYSDSAGTYVTLDSTNPSVYKQLYRAAKAKLKLRLKATIMPPNKPQAVAVDLLDDKALEREKIKPVDIKPEPRSTYLETVLSQPVPANKAQGPFKTSTGNTRMPGAFCSGDSYMDPPPRPAPRSKDFSQPTLPCFRDFTGTFSIDCNSCGTSVPNEHYHCSICEKGDFDLCQKCVQNGVTCEGEDHWLIKRSIRNGIIVPSVTETCAPRKPKEEEPPMQIPGVPDYDERTCNSCINQLPASAFVTCMDCADFDLCQSCFLANEHGHALAHTFEPVNPILHQTVNFQIKSLCRQARGLVHQATCDGCNKQIIGVRNKCLTCPDWDYCSSCYPAAPDTHPGHRFASLYEPLEYVPSNKEHHRGIFCDGPLCAGGRTRGYIRGDRYKCTVCHDTDFCSNCEALPTNPHNKSHPVIKIKTPIRHVSISTIHESENGQELGQLGDRRLAKHASTETNRTTSTNAATQVQTVAEVLPAEEEPVAPSTWRATEPKTATPADLQAWYESDSTPDGSNFGPKRFVSQSWTLRNPGPETWPAGCAVHYIGGDDMRNLDAHHPSSVSSMDLANRSNVLEESLEPGKTAVFRVLLKSPAREGRYISYWRLKTPDGMPFGHKLWVDINVKDTSIELPIRTAVSIEPQQGTVKDEGAEETNGPQDQQSSTMIFPKLDKESPVSSIHDVSETAPESATAKPEEHDLLDDVESLELEDESDDGFLTDEEYDVLDASDEDFLDAQAAMGPK